jgi:hypothetical protein
MRKALINIFNAFIYSNLIVSLGASLFIWETYILLDSALQIKYVFLGFAATIFVYYIDRLIYFTRCHSSIFMVNGGHYDQLKASSFFLYPMYGWLQLL